MGDVCGKTEMYLSFKYHVKFVICKFGSKKKKKKKKKTLHFSRVTLNITESATYLSS